MCIHVIWHRPKARSSSPKNGDPRIPHPHRIPATTNTQPWSCTRFNTPVSRLQGLPPTIEAYNAVHSTIVVSRVEICLFTRRNAAYLFRRNTKPRNVGATNISVYPEVSCDLTYGIPVEQQAAASTQTTIAESSEQTVTPNNATHATSGEKKKKKTQKIASPSGSGKRWSFRFR